jgi:ribosomal protein S18 acetylase RimI-like enzyme
VAALLLELHMLHVAVASEAFRPTTSADEERRYRTLHLGRPGGQAFVAEENGAIVGYLWIWLVTATPLDSSLPRRYAEIDTLVVAAVRQGAGIGRQLLARAEVWAAAQGVSEMRLVVYEDNPAAIAFYERLGYTTRTRTMRRALDDRV